MSEGKEAVAPMVTKITLGFGGGIAVVSECLGGEQVGLRGHSCIAVGRIESWVVGVVFYSGEEDLGTAETLQKII